MQKSQATFDVIKVLKEVAGEFLPELFQRVRTELGELGARNLRLLDYVFVRYYYQKDEMGGRWYDPYHVAYSTLFAVKLVQAREASPLIVPGIILHDIGYYSPLVDKENWASKNNRIIHMQEGSGMAAEILITNGGFDASEVGAIVGMVVSHDNGYLGITTKDPDRLALRDADRIWVMHPLSFYKDWSSKHQKGEELSLLDLFRSRLISFYGPEEVYSVEWGRVANPDKEDVSQSPPSTNLAKEWRDRQFAAHWQEIQQNILSSREVFQKHIEEHIRAELAAGRG